MQGRQSAELFLQSLELGRPHAPTTASQCALPPVVQGGGAHSLAGEGVGGSQFRLGDTHCGTLCIMKFVVLSVAPNRR